MFDFFLRFRWRVLALFVFLFLGLCYWFFFWRAYSAYHALPAHSALVASFSVGSGSPASIFRHLGNGANLSLAQNLMADLQPFRSQPGLADKIHSRPLVTAFSLAPNDSLHGLFVVDIGRSTNAADLLQQAHLHPTTINFKGHTIYSVQIPGGDRFAVACLHNLLIWSRHGYLVEDALQNARLRDDWWACQTERAAGIFCVVLRSGILAERLQTQMAPDWEHLPALFAAQTDAVAIGFDGKKWRVTVHTRAEKPQHRPGDMPVRHMAAVLPDNTVLAAWAATEQSGALAEFADPNTNDADFQQFLLPWVGKEAAWVLVEPYSAGMRNDRFWVCAVRDEPLAQKRLDEYGRRTGLLRRYQYQTFEVRQFLSRSILEPLLRSGGQDFENPVCVLLDGYAVFAANASALELWIDRYVVSQTLADNAEFLLLRQKMPDVSNRFLFANTAYLSVLIKHLFGPVFLEKTASDIALAQKTGLLGLDLNQSESSLWSGVLACQNGPTTPSVAQILWKMPLGGKAISQPHIVLSPAPGGEALILVQDDQFTLHCFAPGGNLLWKKKLGMPILSAVHGIDRLGNGSICYLLNTAEALWLLDEEGREVAGYPLRLQSPATNGVTPVCFDGKYDYGMFVACANGNLYGFDVHGRPLAGWNPMPGIGGVRHPLVHIKSETNDFFAVQNRAGQLSVFNRIGVPLMAAHNFEGIFSNAPPLFDTSAGTEALQIVNINDAGSMYACRLDGHAEHRNIGDKKNNNDWASDGQSGYLGGRIAVLSDRTLVGIEGGSFEKKFKHLLPSPPDDLFATGQPGMFGTLDRERRQFLLFNSMGNVVPGFPLAGTTPFVLHRHSDREKVFTLIVGNGTDLYAYKIDLSATL
ncbi:MAG: DUF3352 domain-containing protein [Saprospiraceae bacterium]